MDLESIVKTGGVSGGIMCIVLAIYKLCHHCRFRSTCCGKEASMKVDLSPSGSVRALPPESFPKPTVTIDNERPAEQACHRMPEPRG